MVETMFNDTIKGTLEKAEALEKHVKTVTMRAECLATTEADFFKTLLDRQEEAQRHRNELTAQLQANKTPPPTPHSDICAAQEERRQKRQARASLTFALSVLSRAHTKHEGFFFQCVK